MGSKQSIIKIRAGNRASAQLARQATRAEFKYTMNVGDAIYGNLSTNLAGNRAALTGEQTRLAGSLQRLKANQERGSTRISNRARGEVQNAYGSAVAGGNRLNLQDVQVTGRAGSKAVGGQVAAGGILARGNEAAMTTLGQGVQMAQAGAQAQVADALAYRARNDATLAAERDNALSMMVLQNKLDLENYRKKLAMQDQANNTNGQMTAVATTAAAATTGLFEQFRGWIGPEGVVAWEDATPIRDEKGNITGWQDAEGNKLRAMSPAVAAGQYLADNGIAADSPEGTVILAIARAMASAGAGTAPGAYGEGAQADIMAAVNQQMALLYPTYGKYQDTISALVGAAVAQDAAGPTPGSGPPSAVSGSSSIRLAQALTGGSVLDIATGGLVAPKPPTPGQQARIDAVLADVRSGKISNHEGILRVKAIQQGE